jgi:cytochrome oxidase Cu insertion factor (SCO1/SenC/PrrC family)
MLMVGVWLLSTLILWGFAFLPAVDAPPGWLEAARNACFSTMPNGLPDTSGWMVLILGPLSFLVGAFITWWDEILAGSRDLFESVPGKSVMVILGALVVWEASWVRVRIRDGFQLAGANYLATETDGLPEAYPRTSRGSPEFELTDQSGARLSLASLRGKTVFLTFAFAHCQTVCPAIVQQAKSALEGLEQDSVRLLIVTLDPWRDTPSSLPTLAQKWKVPQNGHLLSGTVPEVTRVLDLYNLPWKRDDKSGDITHPALTYVIDPDGKIAYTFNNAPVQWLIESVRRVAKEADRRG